MKGFTSKRIRAAVALLAAGFMGLTASAQETWLPLYNWWNAERGDNFATTEEGWRGTLGRSQSGYTSYAVEGFLIDPNTINPLDGGAAGLVPVYRWYNPETEDNFTTTDTRWQPGTSHNKGAYVRPKLLGYMYSPNQEAPSGTEPMWSWWNSGRGDNFMTIQPGWGGNERTIDVRNQHIVNGRRREGYTLYRLEGYVPRPLRPFLVLEDIANEEARVIASGDDAVRPDRGCPAGQVLDVAAANDFIARRFPEGEPVNDRSERFIYFFDNDRNPHMRLRGYDRYNLPISRMAVRFRQQGLFDESGRSASAIGLHDMESSTGLHLPTPLNETSRDYEGNGFLELETRRPNGHTRADQELSFKLRRFGTDYEFVVTVANDARLETGLIVKMLPDNLCIAEN